MTYSVIFFSKELEKRYKELEESDPKLYKSMSKAIERLKENRLLGQKIHVDRISKKYAVLYGTQHFWRIKLNSEWRLIYTIKGSHIEVLAVILDWFTDHKKYQKEVYG
jgi:mRNA-degrading endonuclease RelE of RelBE toxin-antitoxin system